MVEMVSVREARRRGRLRRRVAIVEAADGSAVDATDTDSTFRSINHSGSPNAFIRMEYGHVEFYALRDIQKGEELACDYGVSSHGGRLR